MAQAIRDEAVQGTQEAPFGARARCRAERASGLREGRPGGPRQRQHAQRATRGKTVIGDDGAIEIAVPRDRNGSFEPQIAAKGQTRLEGFGPRASGDRIIGLYARGLSVREI